MPETKSAEQAPADLTNPDTYRAGHPHETYDALRSRCPVHWQDQAQGFWAVTGYSELCGISKDTERYTSTKGFRVKVDSFARLGEDIDRAMQHTMLQMDPPLHTEFKRALTPFFSPGAIRTWEPRVRAHAIAVLDSIGQGGTVDVVRKLAAPFPIRVLCDLLGVPEEDRQRVYEWTNRLTGSDDPEYNTSPQQAAVAFREVFDYGRRLFAQRRESPGDDILSVAAGMRLDGKPLGELHTDSLFVLMLAAGNETTRNTITSAIYYLGTDTEQRAKLIADPELIRNAVEEVLRRASPVIQMRRSAKCPVQISGVDVRTDQRLGLFYGAANHDERVYPDPQLFDVERKNARNHVAFGFATHNCLGAPMARLEVRVFLEELLRRFPNFTLAGEPAYLRSDFLSGIKRLEVDLK